MFNKNNMNLEILEQALKKRWSYIYNWWRKQNNIWDKNTNFIYKIRTFSELLNKINNFDEDLKNYALNRWYNYWSAMWAEYIFSTHPNVKPNKDIYDKLKDFTIDEISFDHKTSVYPKWFGQPYNYWKENKEELIKWLYDNQSQQWRKHLKNRLFIVLYDPINQEHWKMKAEIKLLKDWIDLYMKWFNKNKLCKFNFWEWTVYSDIIWITK